MTLDSRLRILVLATGGTIDKHYDTRTGGLSLASPGLDAVLNSLWQPSIQTDLERLMAIDSLDMTGGDQQLIIDTLMTRAESGPCHALIVTHGTDRLVSTARLATERGPGIPVIFTGAMVPAACAGSDALANLAQSVLAASVLTPGVYVVFHGCAIPAEQAVKDVARQTFIDQRWQHDQLTGK